MSIVNRAKEKVINYLFRRMVGMSNNELDLSKYDNSEEVNKNVEIYEGNPYWLQDGVKSTRKAAAIVSYLANKTTLELKSNVVGKSQRSKRANFLDTHYQNLVSRARKIVELVLVEGSCVLKPFVFDGRLGVDYLSNQQFLPIRFNELDKLVEVMFFSKVKVGKKDFTRIEHHSLNSDGTYVIKNSAHVGDGYKFGKKTQEVPLSNIPDWAHLEPEITVENISTPLFSYMRTPFANAKDFESPLGVSIFEKILVQLEQYDLKFDEYMWEYTSKESKYVIPRQSAMNFESELPNRYRRNRDRIFLELDYDPDHGSATPYTVPDSNIRSADFEVAIDRLSRELEFNIGLAYGEISNAQNRDLSATEVRASKERSYATISDIQKMLMFSFKEVVEALNSLATLYSLTPDDMRDYEVTFYFDDSVAVERATPMLQEVKLGILRPEYYLMERYGYTLEEALERVPGGQSSQVKQDKTELPKENKDNSEAEEDGASDEAKEEKE